MLLSIRGENFMAFATSVSLRNALSGNMYLIVPAIPRVVARASIAATCDT